MPRWNNNLKSNTEDILSNFIKNIRPDLYQTLVAEVLEANVENNKKIIEKFLRTRLNLKSTSARHTKQYWLDRGWSENEAYVKSKENTQKGHKSIYSRGYWVEKINPVTGTHYTEEEADFERDSRRPIRKEYWITQGYSETEAIKLAAETKNNNNKKGAKSSENSTVRNITSKRCIEYYTSRGYSEEDAILLRSNSQKFFSKEICIQKYGGTEGIRIWQDRQDRWQSTLNAKPDEEKARINRSKLSKGITVSKAEKLIAEKLAEIGFIIETQFTLFHENKKQYVYDIVSNKKIIEYHGDFWHLNPIKFSEDFINPRTKISAKDKWAADKLKIQFAKDNGYEVLVIWESEFKQNQDETIKRCIQFLTQSNENL